MLTRFAPSPTGELHLGHAYSAVLAHDAARRAGGKFLIRIDDIDGSRSRESFVGASLADLAWLGIDWDGDPVRQSARLGDYAAALDNLRARGLVYPCFCTRADIAASLSAPHGPSGAIYPGTCRGLSETERTRRLADEPHCWRLDTARALAESGDLQWEEAGQGLRSADPAAHGDIVLARKDAPASYHLASTLDDAAMGVTHVIRGADLIASTDVHRLLQALLDLPTPLYRHHALVCGPDGKRLAKRDAAASLASLRAAGIGGRALAADLAAGRLPAGYSLQNP
ncbi:MULTISPECIES: tRNA glutamyl-Q(34) synthetase GluQRS [unclassified Sphingopyxis]|uniref:tRNA glutamyl-Q(34) synthetase GluQRS n=1 Tax=unclassified Sphingopyxis TaxID=2614943 RepID=UPI0007311207|nr:MULTISPECIES: tRNA glutamyl-Q(34) synthetase GluQRS [unclassified Sphingopyxis]KTD99515.1 glutamyl-Q tRNA(Asp) synthetase [Sphingopyxis sp. H012]KTE04871.1 glutamyl-Q tRNA(Asp) synthetase [Sphingopyxis sp. H093]KTE05873.1 glutamyl-Q tRNA(Asp) synthetase [Sphingopyxis sp. H053]KTE18722.1 glutamyl-Q tRNA(Asp) synthetase [Sphingopyxis sp. H080]KTE30903.1 glutamyl-Q tRNA(Asp) synthetase [Sphingopyxis sp. H038]